MWDEPGSNQLPDQYGEVGGDGDHAVLDVVVQLSTVFCDLYDLQETRRV